ncbi:MAG: glycoside hydrolase family 3 C-terminal domain-containing protein [Kiritimatiellales bacterium]
MMEIAEKIETLLRQMTLDEKIGMCHANTKFSSAGISRLGIPDIVMSDGPHGVRQEIAKDSWRSAGRDDDDATYLPAGTALASTWNPDCAKDFGYVLGREARERGKDIILAPGINIIRTPLCGRNFEYMSEDPHLIRSLAPGLIHAIQEQDVAACVKHFAANNQELNRFETNAEVDERTLREIYFPGFEAAVFSGVLTVMGAYNRFRGQHCCHNHYLLQQVLKDEWKFPGLVVSDWAGTHNTDEAVFNGLDIEMGTPVEYDEYYLARPFREGVLSGNYPESLLDEKIRRILYVVLRSGMMKENRKPGARNTAEHQAIAKNIARESIVLLKNDAGGLPVNPDKVKSVLVVGDNADRKMSAGGGSSEVKALYEITPLEGIRTLMGSRAKVEYIKGYPVRDIPVLPVDSEYLAIADQHAGIRGWHAGFFQTEKPSGTPVFERVTDQINFSWEQDPPADGIDVFSGYAVRWRGTLTAPETGEYKFGVYNTNEAAVSLNGAVLLKTEANTVARYSEKTAVLKSGEAYEILIEYYYKRGSSRIEFGWLPPEETVPDIHAAYASVIDAAQRADTVIFIGGLNHQYDTEARDRPDMRLPEGQDGLLEAVLKIKPDTIVIIMSGAPVEMPWINHAATVLWTSYAGMEGGTALAEVLFGAVNPSGKLPITFPEKLADSPAHAIGEYQAGICRYKEEIFVGYRYFDSFDVKPLFEFGRGLSYTEFTYSDLHIQPSAAPDSIAEISCRIKNSGSMDGAETVQFYLQDVECSVKRPQKELRGFVKAHLAAGEEKTVSITLSLRDMSFYNVSQKCWCVEPGTFVLYAGSSSRDLRLHQSFEYTGTGIITDEK